MLNLHIFLFILTHFYLFILYMDPIVRNESNHPDWLPYWQPNNKALKCSTCDIYFTLVTRRHHCRKCGKIFCNNCWGHKIFVDIYDKKVPVCNSCFIAQ